VIDAHDDDVAPGAPHERGKKAVHVIEVWKGEEHRSIEHLEPAPRVGSSIAKDSRPHAVGDA
jgi:hypothetical protein